MDNIIMIKVNTQVTTAPMKKQNATCILKSTRVLHLGHKPLPKVNHYPDFFFLPQCGHAVA